MYDIYNNLTNQFIVVSTHMYANRLVLLWHIMLAPMEKERVWQFVGKNQWNEALFDYILNLLKVKCVVHFTGISKETQGTVSHLGHIYRLESKMIFCIQNGIGVNYFISISTSPWLWQKCCEFINIFHFTSNTLHKFLAVSRS